MNKEMWAAMGGKRDAFAESLDNLEDRAVFVKLLDAILGRDDVRTPPTPPSSRRNPL